MIYPNIITITILSLILLPKNFGNPTPNEGQSTDHAANKEDKSNNQLVDENGLKEEDLRVLIEEAMDWAHYIGMVERTSKCEGRSDLCQVAPVTMFPSPYPKKQFVEATEIQKAMNLLYFRVASDVDFLLKIHEEVAQTDEHVARLMKLLKKVHEEGVVRQPITGLFQRADYMLNIVKEDGTNTEYEIKQLEVNNGSIANTSTDRLTTDLHRHMLEKAGVKASVEQVPDNLPDKAIVEALYMAWNAFDDPNAVILMVGGLKSNPGMLDSRQLEYELAKKSNNQIKVARLTLQECYQRLVLDPVDFKLRFDDGRVVGVVNTRVSALGWVSKRNPDEEMEVRLMFERSTAVKIPSLAIAVSCSKKVQQVLTKQGMLERFFPLQEDANTVAAIRRTFASLWGLEQDDEKTKAVIQDAIDHPERYVLKINRECGGNNIWDDEIPKKLQSFKTPIERAGHILMQKLRPMVAKNYMLRALEETKFGEIVSELGVYGVLVGDLRDGSILYNVQPGHMMKTKWSHANEGGIARGGVADTPFLF